MKALNPDGIKVAYRYVLKHKARISIKDNKLVLVERSYSDAYTWDGGCWTHYMFSGSKAIIMY